MDDAAKLADLAALLADRSRARMVVCLMDGSARPASELARLADVSAASASMHLAKLVGSGILVSKSEGRNKYYRIATPAIAHAVEALGVASQSLTVMARASDKHPLVPNPWGFARTCYDHLAGRLGVELALALQRRKYVKIAVASAQHCAKSVLEKYFSLAPWHADETHDPLQPVNEPRWLVLRNQLSEIPRPTPRLPPN